MRTTFNVPFAKLGTADLRVPLSANPRYHYDKQRRVVTVTHDPLPKLAHDTLPAQGMRRARDQEQPDNGALSEQIRMFLRERLDPEDWQALCEMLGIEPDDDGYDEDPWEDDRLKVRGASGSPDWSGGAADSAPHRPRPMTAEQQRSFNERFPYFDRLKMVLP